MTAKIGCGQKSSPWPKSDETEQPTPSLGHCKVSYILIYLLSYFAA